MSIISIRADNDGGAISMLLMDMMIVIIMMMMIIMIAMINRIAMSAVQDRAVCTIVRWDDNYNNWLIKRR